MKPYVRIFFKEVGWQRWADIPLPEGTSFVQYMGQAHFEGFICSAAFYIPVDQIKLACPVQHSDKETPMDFTKVTMQ
jgi:hypothetical protein